MGISGVPMDKAALIRAIIEKKGFVNKAAASLGCERETIFNWAKKDPDVAEALKTAREEYNKSLIEKDREILEDAYTSIHALVKDHDVTATIFTLKAKAGWSDKSHIDGTVNINLNRPYDEKNKA